MKPPILSDEQIVIKIWEMAQASRDLKYPPYEDNVTRQETLKWALSEIQQAKAEVAREIFGEIENNELSQWLDETWWQSFKSQYTGGKK